jgi:flagellar biosynthesis protein FlhG
MSNQTSLSSSKETYNNLSPLPTQTRTIAITSGKGGVGKTNFVVNVGLELSKMGRWVTIFDADLALANADMLFGVTPSYHIGHVLSGKCSLNDAVLEVAPGLRLIPGSSGIEELANLSLAEHMQLVAELETMEKGCHYMFIDTPAGIADNVMGIACAASEVIIVTMPEPTAIVDAYATIKTIHKYSPTKPIWVIVNSVVGIGEGDEVFAQLNTTVNRFLNHPIEYLGMIPRDTELAAAVRQQKPIIEYAPNRPASRSLRLIAKQLDQKRPNGSKTAGSFWRSLTERATEK